MGSHPHESHGAGMFLDEIQAHDLNQVLSYVRQFWKSFARSRASGRVTPTNVSQSVQSVLEEPLPFIAQALPAICETIDHLVVPNIVKNSHPLFLGYVTPPS